MRLSLYPVHNIVVHQQVLQTLSQYTTLLSTYTSVRIQLSSSLRTLARALKFADNVGQFLCEVQLSSPLEPSLEHARLAETHN